MWLLPPAMLCDSHRLGEHYELHLHRHNFVKHHSIAGRVSPIVQIEPEAMRARHDELAATLKSHKSLYMQPDLSYLPPEHRLAKVDLVESARDLSERCPRCAELIRRAKKC
jgi:hypothetical protein